MNTTTYTNKDHLAATFARNQATLQKLQKKHGLTGEKGDYSFNPPMMKAIAFEATYPIEAIKIIDIKGDFLVLSILPTDRLWMIRLTPKQYMVKKNSLSSYDAGC